MTRSMFDPTAGPDKIDEGGRYTGPSAENISHMPPDVVDGVVDEEPDARVPLKGTEPTGLDDAGTEQLAEAAEAARAETLNPDDIAAPTSRRNPGEEATDDAASWMEDT